MIIKFEDYLNENWHDFMMRKLNKDDAGACAFFFFVGGLGQLFNFVDMQLWTHILIYVLGLFLVSPTLVAWYRGMFRGLYIKIKSGKGNLIKSDRRYRYALEKLEKNPDLKDELHNIKLDIVKSVKDGNRKKVADCVNRIDILAKKIEYRELLPDSFNLNDEEKEIIKKQEEELKKKDPYGEEIWEDEK